jgi:uncharacterized NAD(P)/FAD-binding protein YdhS
MATRAEEDVIAIVGGGFTGGAVAYHLARRATQARILVFEPRELLGAGLAYDTADDSHRINVPAGKMSLVPGDESHFSRWIAATDAVADDPGAKGPDGNLYPRRRVFGRYVASELAPLIARRVVGHVRETIVRIARSGEDWEIETAAGQSYRATIVVLATTHPPPAVPQILDRAFGTDPRLVRDPSDGNALAAIGPEARVLIVGTGLTMADVVASLDAHGHNGRITAISRRGLLSRGHPAEPQPLFGSFNDHPHTALSLLRAVRSTIDDALKSGHSWHGVLDQVRAQAQSFWPGLGVREQRRLVRHLRPFWDVHRFRIAPQVAGVLQRRIADGSLEVFAASLRSAALVPGGLEVEYARRQAERSEKRVFDAVVITTGPGHGTVLGTAPHLAGLAEAGWIVADPVGLGIATSRKGHALDRNGQAVADLFIAGPLARGTFGELMGLPQVSDYADFIANEVHEALVARPRLEALEA